MRGTTTLAVICLTLLVTGPVRAQEPDGPFGAMDGFVLSIETAGDMAGAIEPCGCKIPIGGLARRAGYARELAKRTEGRAAVLSVDAGRIFDPARQQAGAIYDAAIKNEWILRGLATADLAVLNVAAADLMVLDAWRSKDGYSRRISEFPALDRFVSANVEPASAEVTAFPPYVVREVAPAVTSGPADRIRVGFLGLTEPPDAVAPGSRWKVNDPVAAARKFGPELRSRCDLLVVLAYVDSNTASRIEEAIPGVDVIVVANRKAAPKGEATLDRPATVTVAAEAKFITEIRAIPTMSAMASRRWVLKRRTIVLGPEVPDDPDTRLLVQQTRGAARRAPVTP